MSEKTVKIVPGRRSMPEMMSKPREPSPPIETPICEPSSHSMETPICEPSLPPMETPICEPSPPPICERSPPPMEHQFKRKPTPISEPSPKRKRTRISEPNPKCRPTPICESKSRSMLTPISEAKTRRTPTIDDYRVQRVISPPGPDSESIVFIAKHNITSELVAVKAQHHEGKGNHLPPEVMFHSEASGRHPRIVELREVTVEHGSVYMIMEYVENDLRSLLVKRFSEERVRTIMQQLLQGLAHIHSMGILHRDINPENLLVTREGDIKIADFGLACRSSGAYPAGKLPYCAPEMLLGGVEYTTSVDIWSAGCIMYELLFQEILFDGSDEFDQLDLIFWGLGKPDQKEWPDFYDLQIVRSGTLDLPGIGEGTGILADMLRCSGLSYYGFDLLTRMLTANPQQRITADAALSHLWFKLEDNVA